MGKKWFLRVLTFVMILALLLGGVNEPGKAAVKTAPDQRPPASVRLPAAQTANQSWAGSYAFSGPFEYTAVIFDQKGNIITGSNSIAMWNAEGRTTLGEVYFCDVDYGNGIDPHLSLALGPQGQLYAGGNFCSINGVSVYNIARWDGAQWSALGESPNGMVEAIATDPAGNLFVGGEFTQIGGIAVKGAARWDGSAWHALGAGFMGDAPTPVRIHGIAVDSAGQLFVSGYTVVCGWSCSPGLNDIQKWDGSTWQSIIPAEMGRVLGKGISIDGAGYVYASATLSTSLPDGTVQTFANGAAVWDGVTWAGLGLEAEPVNFTDIKVDGANHVYGVGSVNNVSGVYAFTAAAWARISPIGAGRALGIAPNNQLYASLAYGQGDLRPPLTNPYPAYYLFYWNGVQWTPIGNGLDNQVMALAPDGSGGIYAGGVFYNAGGSRALGIAHWDGKQWSPLGEGLFMAYDPNISYTLRLGTVSSILPVGGGRLYAGGAFARAGAVEANNVAYWDGQAWSALGAGLGSQPGGQVAALLMGENGHLIAGGSFASSGSTPMDGVAEWDGSQWVSLGSNLNGTVYSLAQDSSGSLYAGGRFSINDIAYNVARWDGANWQGVGAALSTSYTGQPTSQGYVLSMQFDQKDNLYVGGTFNDTGDAALNGVARWDGSNWRPLGNDPSGNGVQYSQGPSAVHALVIDADGSIYVGGKFDLAGGNPARSLAHWNGFYWEPVGGGLAKKSAEPQVFSLMVDPLGKLDVGGLFDHAGGREADNFGSFNLMGLKKPPVIFIPGIMGSRLVDQNNQEQVWVDVCRMLGLEGGLMPLKLNADGTGAADAQYNNIRPPSGRAGLVDQIDDYCGVQAGPVYMHGEEGDIYQTFLNHFLDPYGPGYVLDTNFFIFPYDWRKDLTGTAAALDSEIERVKAKTGAGQVAIVAHSMGGLVARQYIADINQAKKISQLITLGTPYLGAPKAYAMLLGLDSIQELFFVQNDTVHIGVQVPNLPTTQELAATFPAFYELMPTAVYFTVKGGGFYAPDLSQDVTLQCPGCLSYSQTYTKAHADHLNSTIWDKAVNFHAGLDQKTNWNYVPVTIIAGNNQQTIIGIAPYRWLDWGALKVDSGPLPTFTPQGDGTVSLISSTLSSPLTGINLRGTASFYTVFAKHADLVKNAGAIQLVDCTLGLSTCDTPKTMQAAAAQAGATGVQIIASPVNAIDVSDAQGRHTGPVPALNMMEQGVPGSTYFTVGEVASAALVGGSAYTVTIHPSGTQPVDLKVLLTAPDGSVTQKIYPGIRVSSSSQIRLSGDPTVQESWELDKNGDGSAVEVLTPAVVYAPGAEVDSTPPAAAISLSPALPGPGGWYAAPVTVTLSASDSGAGVDRIEYAFGNDRQPRVYTGPFTVDPAQFTTLYVAAIDRAGNVQSAPASARIGPEQMYLPVLKK